MEVQEQKAWKTSVLLPAVIKQNYCRCDVSETPALTQNTLFYNHDDESVGKTRLSFAVALARFTHTETPPIKQIHTQREKMNQLVSLHVGLQVVKRLFLAEEASHCDQLRF